MTAGDFNVEAGDVVLFLDAETSQAPDHSGANQVGIVDTQRQVLFCRARTVVARDLGSVRAHATQVLRLREPEYRNRVLAYFNNHRGHYRLFLTGLRALQVGNLFLFDTPSPMPSARTFHSYKDFESSWDTLELSAQVGDAIFTFDRRSTISRIIAWIDQGAWSHVAVYVGDGLIQEAVAAGVVRRELRTYRDARFHVGLYRFYQPIRDSAAALHYADTTLGMKYNYWGAVALGVATLLHRRTRERTPNGIIYGGRFFLVTHV